MLGAGLLLACAPIALAAPDCTPVRIAVALPAALDESSGVAVGIEDDGILWSHNDDGSTLFALDLRGSLLGTAAVRPELRDWEDLAAAPCDAHGSCLYLADTGDNAERRRSGSIKIVRMAEPALPLPEGPLRGETFPIRLPDGPRDVEALFVLPGERIHLVTKGRNHAVTVYAYPPPLRPDTVTLVEVQRLSTGREPLADQVTGASASADGRTVVIRTYQSLSYYVADGDTLSATEDGFVNLRTLDEAQGEAVSLGADGLVVLTSEAGLFGAAGSMNVLRCRA